MGEEGGFAHHGFTHRPDVVEGRCTTLIVEERSGLGPAILGAIAEREEGFGAAMLLAGPGNGHHILGNEKLAAGSRWFGKGAVGTGVAAQRRERDEHLARR